MKKLLVVLSILLSPMLMNAQGILDKMQKFIGEEDKAGTLNGSMYTIAGEGWLLQTDGTQTDGILKMEIGTDNSTLKQIWFTPKGSVKEEKVKIKEIAKMQINDRLYQPVRMKEDDGNIGNSTVLMEQLHQKDTDKFKMYMLRKMEVTSGFNPTLSRNFYVVLPDFKNAHEIVDITFTPFAKKMSKFLEDCPDLADKISKKMEGYKYNMFNGAANNAVFYKIMEEYNACGQ